MILKQKINKKYKKNLITRIKNRTIYFFINKIIYLKINI